MNKNKNTVKIKKNEKIYALKIKTESNGLGIFKTIIVLFLIALQGASLAFTHLFFLGIFEWFIIISLIMTLFTCIYVLSSDFHGQAKALWILFLIVCFGFGYFFYFMSDKHVLFARSRKKYKKIFKDHQNLQKQADLTQIKNKDVQTNCNYLFNAGQFAASLNSKTTYYPSGAKMFDDILEEIEKATEFIFIEYYIIANGVLLNRILDILKEKVKEGVDVRIIYDDMGSHGTLKRKTKKEIIRSGIKLKTFNRMIPIFNIALNLRDHRKIVVVDGKVSFTGGNNLADEYINEKRAHGYWKDTGIKIEGNATDNFTIAFLTQWEFMTNEKVDYKKFINRAEEFENHGVVVPYVSGPHYPCSIAQNMYANQISNAKEKLYIMTPYFVPDETITNLIINKARSGVDVKIILPDIADKKFVYCVSRNNAEKLLKHGVKIYTMTSSFVHSKVVYTENSAIVGSINMDLRSFYQQFESAVFTDQQAALKEIEKDFDFTINHSKEVTLENQKRNKITYRIIAGFFNIVSTFM